MILDLSSSPQQAAEIHRSGLPSRLPLEHRGNAFESSPDRASSHYDEVDDRPAASWSPPSVRSNSTSKATLAVFIFIVAALALTSLCIRLRTKALGAGLPQRRLARSEEGDGSDHEELNGIVEECLAMEKAYQTTSGFGVLTAANRSVLPTFQPAAFSSGETASMTGPMDGASRSLEPKAEGKGLARLLESPYSSTSAPSESASSSPLFYSLAPGAWLESIPAISASEVGPQGWATGAEETAMMAGSMHEAIQTAVSHFVGPAAENQVVAPSVASSEWSPSAFAEGYSSTPSSDLLSSGAWLPDIPPLMAREVRPQGALMMEQAPQEDGQPSTSAAARANHVARSPPSVDKPSFLLHPFIRLPTAPRGLSLRPMDPDLPTINFYRHLTSAQLLGTLRELFSKRKLTFRDANELLDTTESLVRFARSHLRPVSTARIAHIVRHVGIFFMVADAVVSAAEILRQELISYPWWKSFIASFPTHYSVKKPPKDVKEIAHVNYSMLKRLIASLEIYKAGLRPAAQEVLSLKRELLCSPTSLTYFRASRWDPWREDDKKFVTLEADFFDDSDAE